MPDEPDLRANYSDQRATVVPWLDATPWSRSTSRRAGAPPWMTRGARPESLQPRQHHFWQVEDLLHGSASVPLSALMLAAEALNLKSSCAHVPSALEYSAS